MTRPSEYDTPTMAKVFADQGYLRKAAEIYRRLVARYPRHQDLRQALAELENTISMQQGPSRKEVGLLLREWRALIKNNPQAQPSRRTDQRRQQSRKGGEENDV